VGRDELGSVPSLLLIRPAFGEFVAL
jgi:hypothetical protein